jgi:hypothetical protein
MPPPERRPQRDRLALRGALLRLTPPLETLAEDVLGVVSRIDLVTRDPDGAVTLVLVAQAGADLARLAEGIAQRAWLAPRLDDWNQIAPHLALQADAGVALLLVAPHFDDRTRAAAQALGPTGVRLAELLPRGDLDVELRLVGGAEAPVPPRPDGPTPRADGAFRSGLRD